MRKPKGDDKGFANHQRRAHIHEVVGDLHQDVARIQFFLEAADDIAAGAFLRLAYLKIQEAARTFNEIEPE